MDTCGTSLGQGFLDGCFFWFYLLIGCFVSVPSFCFRVIFLIDARGVCLVGRFAAGIFRLIDVVCVVVGAGVPALRVGAGGFAVVCGASALRCAGPRWRDGDGDFKECFCSFVLRDNPDFVCTSCVFRRGERHRSFCIHRGRPCFGDGVVVNAECCSCGDDSLNGGFGLFPCLHVNRAVGQP